MELNLTPELEDLIAARLATGRYANAEQIVIEALKGTMLLESQRNSALDALKHMFDDGSEESATARDTLRQHRDEWQRELFSPNN